MTRVEQAVREYIARRERRRHPAGTFDKAGRFTLSERCECCTVRRPSRRFPWSEMAHGRTATHVAHLYGVDPVEVRRGAR